MVFVFWPKVDYLDTVSSTNDAGVRTDLCSCYARTRSDIHTLMQQTKVCSIFGKNVMQFVFHEQQSHDSK